MTDTVVAEGQVKFRDGKKWKTRWVVLRKPSPVADCLSLLVYKEKRKSKDKEKITTPPRALPQAICGLEPGPGYDGVSYSLSILCLTYSVALGFSSREAASAWEARIRYSLGEVHRFSVQVQPGTKLEIGPASLHLCNTLLVLTRDVPPLVIGHWKLSELRRYGAVPDGFVFEGGSRCGIWSGVFYLSSAEGEQISFHLDCIARGVSPGRAQRGPRPPMPGGTPNSLISPPLAAFAEKSLVRYQRVRTQRSECTPAHPPRGPPTLRPRPPPGRRHVCVARFYCGLC
uniref:Docking protein 7 n=1 Tax=Gadus morhua TaxID=8049 RepID=A0A8C4ZWR5_GADMO